MEMVGRLNVCGKKIKFSILIKYYCFFFYGWEGVCVLNPEIMGLKSSSRNYL